MKWIAAFLIIINTIAISSAGINGSQFGYVEVVQRGALKFSGKTAKSLYMFLKSFEEERSEKQVVYGENIICWLEKMNYSCSAVVTPTGGLEPTPIKGGVVD